MSSLKNKVVLVTGSSRGIGAEIAQQFANEGANVVINYTKGKDAAEELVKTIKNNGGNAIALQADISNTNDVTFLFDTIINHFGKIDILINNAGIMINNLIKNTSDDEFNNQFDVNVKGTFNTLREAATKLSENGSIVNLSSTTTRLMMPSYGIYVATKAAVEQLTKVFAKEIGARGINVNAVLPGPTNTELFTNNKSQKEIDHLASLNAFNQLCEPKDVAKIVVFLASDEAKWISGQMIGVNGAMA